MFKKDEGSPYPSCVEVWSVTLPRQLVTVLERVFPSSWEPQKPSCRPFLESGTLVEVGNLLPFHSSVPVGSRRSNSFSSEL